MIIAGDPPYYPTDPHPVRPGTSAALTARTIDATVHPPLVRAQESVAAAIPRLADTVTSPLFLTTVGLTLILVWMAVRLKSRMVGLALSAMLVMALTSFRPAQDSDPAQRAKNAAVREREPSERFERREWTPPTPDPAHDPAPFAIRVPRRPEPLRPDFDRIMQDEEQFRAAVEELRDRIEAELRRRARDSRRNRYEYRSTGWIRRLPKPVREWARAGQQTVVAWAEDH